MNAFASILSGLLLASQLMHPTAVHTAGTTDGACCCVPVVEVSSSCCSADAGRGMDDNCDCRITEDTSFPFLASAYRAFTGNRPSHPAPVLLILATVMDDLGTNSGSRENCPSGLDPPTGRTACIVFCSYLC